MMTDPVADMLTRIRNACSTKKERVDIPMSKLKANIAEILKKEGFISNYRIIKDGRQGVLRIYLWYPERKSAIIGLKRVSKPGRRVYCGKDDIPRVRNGYGIALLSTSKGVMPDSQAREAGVGGEVLCEVW